MKEFKYTITDPEGIHACPARLLVGAITGLDSTVTVIRADGRSVAGTEMTALIDLRIKKGDTITVTVDGGHDKPIHPPWPNFFLIFCNVQGLLISKLET